MLSDDIRQLSNVLTNYATTGIDMGPGGLTVMALHLAAFADQAKKLEDQAAACDIPRPVIDMARILNRKGVCVGFAMDDAKAPGTGAA